VLKTSIFATIDIVNAAVIVVACIRRLTFFLMSEITEYGVDPLWPYFCIRHPNLIMVYVVLVCVRNPITTHTLIVIQKKTDKFSHLKDFRKVITVEVLC